MPIINRPYQDTLYKALNIYRDTMRPFIIRRLQDSAQPVENAIIGSLWKDAADDFKKTLEHNGDNTETAIDINMFEAIIEHNWNPAFISEFAGDGRDILKDLRRILEIRNLVAHPYQRDIDRKQAHDALDRITLILKYVGGSEEADALDRIMDELPGSPTPPVPPGPIPPPEDQAQQIADQVIQQLTQALGKQVGDDLTPVLDSLQYAQQRIADDVVQRIEPLIAAPPPDTDRIATKVVEDLTPVLEQLKLAQQHITDDVAHGIERAVAKPKLDTARITEQIIQAVSQQVNRDLMPVLESLTLARQQITEDVVAPRPDTGQIAEQVRQTVSQQVNRDLIPVLESLTLARQQITEDASEQIRQAVAASRPETDQIAERTTERLMPIIREQASLTEETTAHLLQELRAMSAQITEAIDNTRTTATPGQRRPPPAPRPSVEKPAPISVADSWAGVVNHLRNVKGNQYYLAALLRDCRPIDVWQQRDPEKLILPFRHQYNLKRIEEELSDPRVQETVVQAIANHFGRELEFEVTLSVHAS